MISPTVSPKMRLLSAAPPQPESFDLVVAIWMHLPPTETLLIEPEVLRQELAELELLVLEERERWIEEGPYHRGQSAVVRVLGRKPG